MNRFSTESIYREIERKNDAAIDKSMRDMVDRLSPAEDLSTDTKEAPERKHVPRKSEAEINKSMHDLLEKLKSFRSEISSDVSLEENEQGQGSTSSDRNSEISKANKSELANQLKYDPELSAPTIIETDEGHEVSIISQKTDPNTAREQNKQAEIIVQDNPQDHAEELQYHRKMKKPKGSPKNKALQESDNAATQGDNDAQKKASSCCCFC